MRSGLTFEDLGDLLERPLLATLATYDREGLVVLSPVWFEWWEGGFNVVVGAHDVKSRSLRRDPRASLVVAEAEPPMRGIEIRTLAKLSPNRADVDRRIALRYLMPAAVDSFLASTGEGTMIRLDPGRIRAWDFADEHS